MKKIALILALVLAFSVALVACDETPAESSNPATESTPAESAPVDESTPAENESEPAEESDTAGETVNLAEGKTYTYTDTGLYYITWDEQWTVSKNAAACLTDGVTVGENVYYGDASMLGWGGEAASPVVTIDLGDAKNINELKLYAFGGMDGIALPAAVTVEVSSDGENWTEVTCISAQTDEVSSELSWVTGTLSEITLAPTGAVKAQFVKLTFAKEGNFVFLSEIQVLGK
ncbi:MAG: discoidin domain-containing protein [Ruminococcaceae bacterium]|nr:discoidin domain-containing protein [Oscillospiraceae bacterium]